MMGDKSCGLYGKFHIERTDGRSAPGEKHHGCDYFVLDLTHDPHAVPALRAYAQSCEAEYPHLAADLLAKIGPVNIDFRAVSRIDGEVIAEGSGDNAAYMAFKAEHASDANAVIETRPNQSK